MARYKVDKKKFEEKQLNLQLKDIELQGKYLRDEPLKRSEVDTYNKIRTNGWIKSTLVTFGIMFVTLIAFVIFVLLGNLLFTKGKTGASDGLSVHSEQVYKDFINDFNNFDPDKGHPENEPTSGGLTIIKDYVFDWEFKDQEGRSRTEKLTIVFKLNSVGIGEINSENQKFKWEGVFVPKKVGRTTVKVYGTLMEDPSWPVDFVLDNDSRNLTFTQLLDSYYASMPDGTWAKWVVSSRFLGNSSFLVFVLGLVYFATILGYAVVLIVGVRSVIKTVLTILRKAGYIASDFVTEIVDAVRDELPIVSDEDVIDVTFESMERDISEDREETKRRIELELELRKQKDSKKDQDEPDTTKRRKKEEPKDEPKVKPEVKEDIVEPEAPKTNEDKIDDVLNEVGEDVTEDDDKDIFNL